MPNGDPNWGKKELPKLRAFFHKISKVLKDFAHTHNLKIDKYYHQGSDWAFLFRHPEGGVGKIQVQKCGDDHIMVYPMWWLDDYDANRRDSKHTEGEKCSLDHTALRTLLEGRFKLVLSWRKEDLVLGKPNPYSNWKDKLTKEEFERLNDKYPIPKLD